MKSLLVEIRTEEMPPAQVRELASRFPEALLEELKKGGFADEKQQYAPKEGEGKLATPRRFAALLKGISAESDETEVIKRGPQIAAGIDADGSPTKALAGFMRNVGASRVEDLIEVEEKGKKHFAWKSVLPKRTLAEDLAGIVERVLLNFPAPRLMRWGNNDFKFIRPVKGVMMIHGEEVIGGKVMGLVSSSKITNAHPASKEKEVEIFSADSYVEDLQKKGSIIVDIDHRTKEALDRIESIILPVAGEHGMHFVDEDEEAEMELFDVTADKVVNLKDALVFREVIEMCEFPIPELSKVGQEFLDIKSIFVIASCMKKHHRFLPMVAVDRDSRDYKNFYHVVVVDSNPENKYNENRTAILHNYDSVLRARLQDVRFYIQQDQKISVQDYVEKLKSIVFHKKLGSQYDRISRVCKIAEVVASGTGRQADPGKIRKHAERHLASIPALMAGEYPKLQETLTDLYFYGDNDFSDEFNLVSMCYRIERLVGMFIAGEIPTGSKDPHGLRKEALRIAKEILFGQLEKAKDMKSIITDSVCLFENKNTNMDHTIYDFVLDRVRFVLSTGGWFRFKDVPDDVSESLLGDKPGDLRNIVDKAQALHAFTRNHPKESNTLVAANKRINIELSKGKMVHLKNVPSDVSESLLGRKPSNLQNIADRAKALHAFAKDPRKKSGVLVAANKRINNIFQKSKSQPDRWPEPDKSLFSAEPERVLYEQISILRKDIEKLDGDGRYGEMLETLARIAGPVNDFFDNVLVNDDNKEIRENRFALLNQLRELLYRVADFSKIEAQP